MSDRENPPAYTRLAPTTASLAPDLSPPVVTLLADTLLQLSNLSLSFLSRVVMNKGFLSADGPTRALVSG